MLQRIWIKNFALIHELDLDFSKGFTAISGETGSGKSIFLGALNLILGERADFALIGPKGDKAIVEAEFDHNKFLDHWFENNDIDQPDSLIVRREISQSGRSRAFVNDSPVGLSAIKELCSTLITIHSQYDTLLLKDKAYHQEIFDLLADTSQDLKNWSTRFSKFKATRLELNDLKKKTQEKLAEKDYLRFQLEEIAALSLDKTNVDSIESKLLVLENADELLSIFGSLIDSLGNENGLNSQLKFLKNKIDKSSHLHPSLLEFSQRISTALLDLLDIEAEAQIKLESIDQDPAQLQVLTQWMDQLNRLLTKHNVSTASDLLELESKWSESLLEGETNQERIVEMESLLLKEEQELVSLAKLMHGKRVKASHGVVSQIENLLKEVNLAEFKVKFELIENQELGINGLTDLNFMVQPNKGYQFQNLEKSASGGELSRLMLCLQYLISDKKLLPTVLFDEIDTGISGEVAEKMGLLLHKMGQNFQLIAISHLPQVVSKAKNHIKVEKLNQSEITSTSLRFLTEPERIEEIARLMSGSEINSSALESAKALMIQQ